MTKNGHPDAVFGPDIGHEQNARAVGDTPAEITYNTIAQQVKSLQPRALTEGSLDDVLTIIEYMRDQCLEMDQANANKARLLSDREAELRRREKELAVKQRAVDSVLKVSKPRRGYFWR